MTPSVAFILLKNSENSSAIWIATVTINKEDVLEPVLQRASYRVLQSVLRQMRYVKCVYDPNCQIFADFKRLSANFQNS